MAYHSFYDLDVWKKARQFKLKMYEVIKRFPQHEKFELTSQLRRAARSIPTNISEGHGRRTIKDEGNFCTIARGSHSELFNHLIDAFDCNYITEDELLNYKQEWDVLGKLLNGYMSFLHSKLSANTTQNNSVAEDDVAYIAKDASATFEDFLKSDTLPNQLTSEPVNK